MDKTYLYLAYRPLLYKYLSLLYHKELEWEDWKQQGELILMELVEKYDETKGINSFSSYLKKALYYRLLDERKKFLNFHNIPIEKVCSEETQEKKIDFSSLSEREKEVIFLLYFARYSERETAKYLKISRRSVRVYKDRALKKLAKKLSV